MNAECRDLEAHRPGLYRLVRAKGLGVEDAEDVVQESLIRALQHIPGARDPVPWLRTVAIHLAIDVSRRRSAIRLDSVLERGDQSDAWGWFIQEEERREVRAAVGRLPPALRSVIEAMYFRDLYYREVASELGVDIRTISYRRAEALSRLREMKGVRLCESG